jgi:hypothetical protein
MTNRQKPTITTAVATFSSVNSQSIGFFHSFIWNDHDKAGEILRILNGCKPPDILVKKIGAYTSTRYGPAIRRERGSSTRRRAGCARGTELCVYFQSRRRKRTQVSGKPRPVSLLTSAGPCPCVARRCSRVPDVWRSEGGTLDARRPASVVSQSRCARSIRPGAHISSIMHACGAEE